MRNAFRSPPPPDHTRLTVFRLADARQKTVPGVLYVVERASENYPKFLPGSERRHLAHIFQGQEIRQGKKKAVIGSPRIFSLLASALRIFVALPWLRRALRFGIAILLLVRRAGGTGLRLRCGTI